MPDDVGAPGGALSSGHVPRRFIDARGDRQATIKRIHMLRTSGWQSDSINQRRTHMERNFRALLIAAVLGTTVLTVSPGAQAQEPKYKVGDRVEFSENAACLGAQYAIPS